MNLNFEQAKHFVLRAGFGPELDQINSFSGLPVHQAVSIILSKSSDFMVKSPVLHGFQQLKQMRRANEKQRKLAGKLLRDDSVKLQGWAVQMLLENPNTLHEKMTMFWHNHFTSSLQKSKRSAKLMQDQALLIRKHAMGNFAQFLKEIAYDPMMLVYLDSVSNVKEKPNENYARELLELFTLGEGHYSENDIKEIARSLTGWRIHPRTEEAFLTEKLFDGGEKQIFGKKGRFNSDDVLDILLQHPRTAEFIAEKFWYEFVSIEKPQQNIIKQWAHVFRSSNYDIASLLRAVFTSEQFWMPEHRGKLIKSPVDVVIGTLRTLDLEDNRLSNTSLTRELKRMGQDIFRPPNVKGWPGGLSWIDDQTLPVRKQFLRKLMRGSNNQRSQNSNSMMKENNLMMKGTNVMKDIPSIDIQYWDEWLLQSPAVTDVDSKNPRRRLQAILLDPAYQLK